MLRFWLTLITLIVALHINGEEVFKEKPKTICLNMIVKDESKVIERCLGSVKNVIDYWVIFDTGSTDGTQKIIKEYLKGIPGELHESPWVDFSHNRNEALAYAKGKGDYLLFIDADERLEFSTPLDKTKLTKDYYFAIVQQISSSYQRILLVNNALKWYWKGVLHESLDSAEASSSELLTNVINMANTLDGNRTQDPRKYHKDAEILEKALISDPTNSRYVFFLAQSYLNAKEFELALKNFSKRGTMGGWDQEAFFALYRAGMLQEYLKKPSEMIIDSYSKAYQVRPARAESIYRLAHYFNRQGNYVLGLALSQLGLSIPNPHDIVHTEDWIYDYGLLSTYADSVFVLGRWEDAKVAYGKLLTKADVPESMRKAIEENLRIIKAKLVEKPSE